MSLPNFHFWRGKWQLVYVTIQFSLLFSAMTFVKFQVVRNWWMYIIFVILDIKHVWRVKPELKWVESFICTLVLKGMKLKWCSFSN